jgi:hypothetical protein
MSIRSSEIDYIISVYFSSRSCNWVIAPPHLPGAPSLVDFYSHYEKNNQDWQVNKTVFDLLLKTELTC